MRNNSRDIFRKLFGSRKPVKAEPKTTEVKKPVNPFHPKRKRHDKRWINRHNQFQAAQSNKTKKRRKANKVARKQRKVNRVI